MRTKAHKTLRDKYIYVCLTLKTQNRGLSVLSHISDKSITAALKLRLSRFFHSYIDIIYNPGNNCLPVQRPLPTVCTRNRITARQRLGSFGNNGGPKKARGLSRVLRLHSSIKFDGEGLVVKTFAVKPREFHIVCPQLVLRVLVTRRRQAVRHRQVHLDHWRWLRLCSRAVLQGPELHCLWGGARWLGVAGRCRILAAETSVPNNKPAHQGCHLITRVVA